MVPGIKYGLAMCKASTLNYYMILWCDSYNFFPTKWGLSQVCCKDKIKIYVCILSIWHHETA